MTPSEFLDSIHWIVVAKIYVGFLLVGMLGGAYVGAEDGFVAALAYAGFGVLMGTVASALSALLTFGVGFIIMV